MLDLRLFHIGGTWVAPREGKDFTLIDPSTEEPIGVVALGGPADVEAAVAAARAAFPAWSATPPAERRAALVRLMAAYDAWRATREGTE